MCRKILATLSAVMFILGASKASFAQAHSEHAHSAAEINKADVSGKALDAGNKICPVSGGEINEKTKLTYEYQGKIYNFCCAGCPEQFEKNPEQYIKKVEEELKASSKGEIKDKEDKMEKHDASDHDHHQHYEVH